MEVDLAFQFPPTRQSGGPGPEVEVTVSIPFPEQRPHAVLNFLYMCTGELPTADMIQAFPQLSSSSLPSSPPRFTGTLPYTSVAEAIADGVPPFSYTAVVHVDLTKPKVIELGNSTTKTILTRGFLPDEPVDVTTAAPSSGMASGGYENWNRMQRLEAGTLLCGKIPGIPHTQASRYYLLLEDIDAAALSLPEEEEGMDWNSFPPLGIVRGGSSAMTRVIEMLRKVPLHPRTLVPQKKIELSRSSVRWGPPPVRDIGNGVPRSMLAHLPAPPPSPTPAFAAAAAAPPLTPLPRMAGRVRRRDEDEIEEDEEMEQQHWRLPGEGSSANGGAVRHGFFHILKRFPTSTSRLGATAGTRTFSLDGQSRKRRRFEAGEEEKIDPKEEKMINLEAIEDSSKPFDFFQLQEHLFQSDLEDIKSRQDETFHRKMRRLSKQKAFAHAYDSKVEKKNRMKELVLEKINPAVGRSVEEDGGVRHVRTKRLHRKY